MRTICARAVAGCCVALATIVFFVDVAAAAADDQMDGAATNVAVATQAAELPQALFGDDDAARSAAIEKLKQRPHDAVAALLKSLDDDDFERRVIAGELLLAVAPRDEKTARAFLKALEFTNSNIELETYCQRALVRIGRPALQAVIEHYRDDLVFALCEPGDEVARRSILERLSEYWDDTETEAAADRFEFSSPRYLDEMLALGPQASAAAVGKALEKQPKSNTLFAAAFALGGRGADGLVAGLVKQFDSKVIERRIQAAEALGKIGKPAVPALVAALRKSEHRPWALSGLEQIGPDAAEAVEAIRPLIASEDVVAWSDVMTGPYVFGENVPPPRVGDLAMEALAAIGPAAASAADDILKRELAAGHREMRFAARWASTFKTRSKAFVPLLAHELSADATALRVNRLCSELANEEHYRGRPLTEIRNRARYQDFKYRQDLAIGWSRALPNDERLRERYFAMLREGNAYVDEPGCGAWPNLKDLAPVALAAPENYEAELLRMLAEPGDARIKALYVLTRTEPDSRPAIARAAAALQDEDPQMRHVALAALADSPGYSPELIVALARGGDWEAIDRRGAAVKQAMPQLRELASTATKEGSLETSRLPLLRLMSHWNGLDESLARALAAGLNHAETYQRNSTALALSKSALLPEQTLPVLAAALEEGSKHRETATSEYNESVAQYATAIGRYGAAAREQQSLLLSLALRDRARTDLGNSSTIVDGERVSVDGKALGDGPLAIACLVALGRIGPAAGQTTLHTLRDAFVHTPLHLYQYGYGNNARLAAAVAILQIDGRGRDEDVATVVESLRLVRPEDIAPGLAEALTAVGKKHAEVAPRLRQLLAIAHWRFVGARPERWRFSGTDEHEDRGARFIALARCVAAVSPDDGSLRPMFRKALAWEMSSAALTGDARVALFELLTTLGDRSDEFRELARHAAGDRHWPAVRFAGDEALKQMSP